MVASTRSRLFQGSAVQVRLHIRNSDSDEGPDLRGWRDTSQIKIGDLQRAPQWCVQFRHGTQPLRKVPDLTRRLRPGWPATAVGSSHGNRSLTVNRSFEQSVGALVRLWMSPPCDELAGRSKEKRSLLIPVYRRGSTIVHTCRQSLVVLYNNIYETSTCKHCIRATAPLVCSPLCLMQRIKMVKAIDALPRGASTGFNWVRDCAMLSGRRDADQCGENTCHTEQEPC
jgi:hypothetical protein